MTKSNFNDYAKDLKFYIPKDYIDYKYTANDYRQTTDKLIFKHVISTLR